MSIKKVVVAAAAFAGLLPATLAGTAKVQNNCGYPVYLWSVGGDNGQMNVIPPNHSYAEQYRVARNGGGISLKISKNQNLASITQFEYTLAGNKLFYDISAINGEPFVNDGISLSSPNGNCHKVICPPGESPCKSVYNKPNDDFATHSCSAAADLTLVLCTGGRQQVYSPRRPPSA
ncbi:hypothetical protein PABG_07518 [Paracoccidioides brasiliensis Pb03]|nr:hypothetical protein PABG_07518 [Paracoccidioides brasiliensis Pb03]